MRMSNRWTRLASTTMASALVCSMILSAPAPLGAVAATTVTSKDALAPQVSAPSVLLMDERTGQVLYAKNADIRRFPASTTKIMTLLLALEHQQKNHISNDTPVPVTVDAYQVAVEPGVQSAYTYPGEKWTFDEMIKLIAVYSANDACVSMADYLDHSETQFAAEMNQRAKQLGMINTHFVNSHGLHDPDHYTTAHDLAIVARQLITEFPDILKITGIPSLTIRKTMLLQNTDELLGKYNGLDGLKTGFTDQAGYCFIGTAQRQSMRLISVVLDAPTNAKRFSETGTLLDYGFNNYSEKTVAHAGQTFGNAQVKSGQKTTVAAQTSQDVMLALQSTQKSRLQQKVTIQAVSAPVHKGDTIGTLTYTLDGSVIAQSPLLAAESDDKAGFITLFFRSIGHFIGSIFQGLGHAIGSLFHH